MSDRLDGIVGARYSSEEKDDWNLRGLSGNPAFDPEYLWSFEAGGKSTLADGNAIVNAAVFLYDYTNLQVSTFSEGTVVVTNAAEATILGLEMDVSAVLSDEFTWTSSLMALKAEYDEFLSRYGFIDTPAGRQPNVLDLSGNNMVNAPELSLTSTLNYNADIALGEFSAMAQVAYRSTVYHSQFNEVEVGQSGVMLANIRAGIRFSQARLPGHRPGRTDGHRARRQGAKSGPAKRALHLRVHIRRAERGHRSGSGPSPGRLVGRRARGPHPDSARNRHRRRS